MAREHLSKNRPRKACLFLAPTGQLVCQQAAYIEEHAGGVRVAAYTKEAVRGGRGLDQWPHETWRAEVAEKDVLCCTGGAAKNALSAGHLRMTDFSLLVVDEAHHCSKGHDFKTIMDLFYHPLPPEQRPKVLGLTASPIKARQRRSAGVPAARCQHSDAPVQEKGLITKSGELNRLKLVTCFDSLERTLDAQIVTCLLDDEGKAR